jgi:predicted AAA+ superfamily ATPase
MPKLYFLDPGLTCSLLGIENKKQIFTHPLKGNLFESFILCEILKSRFNRGVDSNVYFWRDKTGHEIDCIIEKVKRIIPLEIKAGKTPTEDFFANLLYWKNLSRADIADLYVVYGGTSSQKRSSGNLLSWKDIARLL